MQSDAGVLWGSCLLPCCRWSACCLSLCVSVIAFHSVLWVEYFCRNLVTTAECLRTTMGAEKSKRGQQGGDV